MKSKRYPTDSDLETELRDGPEALKKNHWYEVPDPDKLDTSSQALSPEAGSAVDYQANAEQVFSDDQEVDLSPIQWNATDPDEYGPLSEGLQNLFVDEVDPLTAEVTRRPIPLLEELHATGENPSGQESVIPAPNPDEQQLDEPDGIESSKTEEIEDTEQKPELMSILPTDIDDALQTIVTYLLSPEGAELKRGAREAAYQARKVAYETASQEIQSQTGFIQARLGALEVSFQKALDSVPGAQRIAEAQLAWQAAQEQAKSAEKAHQDAREKLAQAAGRAERARFLANLHLIPDLILSSIEAGREAAEGLFEKAQAEHEQAQRKLQEATQAHQAAKTGVQGQGLELEEQLQREKAQAEAELESLQAHLKARMEELANQAPEVVLWKAIQKERQRQEDEIAVKLIAQLPAQGIKRTLQEAARLGIAENKKLLQAIAERQARVNTLIEACRAQAERLTAYPEVLPEHAFALLVRGDAIRVVDPAGRELAVHYAQGDGSEFHTVRSTNGRRWKLEPYRDCWLVKQ